MHWRLLCGDILEVRADVLVCSANVYLTMSGGVGGAFLLRYGDSMQEALRKHLEAAGVRHVPQGTVVETAGCGSPYRVVLHAVAVDALYSTSANVVTSVVRNCLRICAERHVRTVALPALATGYGRLSIAEFANGLRDLIGEEFAPLESASVCFRHPEDLREFRESLPQVDLEA